MTMKVDINNWVIFSNGSKYSLNVKFDISINYTLKEVILNIYEQIFFHKNPFSKVFF